MATNQSASDQVGGHSDLRGDLSIIDEALKKSKNILLDNDLEEHSNNNVILETEHQKQRTAAKDESFN